MTTDQLEGYIFALSIGAELVFREITVRRYGERSFYVWKPENETPIRCTTARGAAIKCIRISNAREAD